MHSGQNTLKKIVISTTIKDPGWNNTVILNENLVDERNNLKKEDGKNLVIFGSPSTSKELLKLGLIDEMLLTICPVILGDGKSIFEDGQQKYTLKLLKSNTFASGIIATHYEVQK